MRTTLFAAALALLATTCHAQWQLQDAHTTADLRGIDYVGHGVAWASGTNGTVLRTEDMGFVWQLCAIPPNAEHLDFRGIQAFDNNTAIVMSSGKGDLSRLYKTTDGCQTWKLVFTNPDKDGFWDALSAADRKDPNQMMLLGDPVDSHFVVEQTWDGGTHWTREQTQPSLPGEGAFAASNSSLLVQWVDGIASFGTGSPEGARLFTECDPCTNQTENWTASKMPMFARIASGGIFSIRQSDWKHLVAVGGDFLNPNVSRFNSAYSTDGGQHWTAANTPPHGYRSAVAYDAPHNTWITVGPNGTDISTDDGRNWRALKPDPKFNDPPDADQHWNALSLPFVVGPHGRIGILRQSALKTTAVSPPPKLNGRSTSARQDP